MKVRLWWVAWLLSLIFGGVVCAQPADGVPYVQEYWLQYITCVASDQVVPADGGWPCYNPLSEAWPCDIFLVTLCDSAEMTGWSRVLLVGIHTGTGECAGKIGYTMKEDSWSELYICDWAEFGAGWTIDEGHSACYEWRIVGYNVMITAEAQALAESLGGLWEDPAPYIPLDDPDTNEDGYGDVYGWPGEPPACWPDDLPWPPPWPPWQIPDEAPDWWPTELPWPPDWPDWPPPPEPPAEWWELWPWPPDGWPPEIGEDGEPDEPPIEPPPIEPDEPDEGDYDPDPDGDGEDEPGPDGEDEEITDNPDTFLDESIYGENYNNLKNMLLAKLNLEVFAPLWNGGSTGMVPIEIEFFGMTFVLDVGAYSDEWWVVAFRTILLVFLCLCVLRGVIVVLRQW